MTSEVFFDASGAPDGKGGRFHSQQLTEMGEAESTEAEAMAQAESEGLGEGFALGAEDE
ncbi:hypothetical protein ABT404_03340 [Streptomyces hyaluromycini]|uniref:SPOR domain-containing protein n=1 Tax=Streptomyces hyaluromycini TaxID=1377993 RepID=A0ABV1WNY2_9ACTN